MAVAFNVGGVEGLSQRRGGEIGGQPHFHGLVLSAIAHLRVVLEAQPLLRTEGGGDVLCELVLQAPQRVGQAFNFAAILGHFGGPSLRSVVTRVGQQHAESRIVSRHARNDEVGDAKLLGEFRGMQGAIAAIGHHGEVARILAALDRNAAQRA